MGKLLITDFLLYRWRYVLGYTAIGVLLLSLVLMAGFVVPGGLSQPEMDSAVTSNQTPLTVLLGQAPSYIVHLPYHLLQQASLSLFGVTTWSVKLPSLILAVFSVLALYALLRIWFRRNVAIITTVIAVTTGQFLLLAQLGTPEVSYLFWNGALLMCASMLARTDKLTWLWVIGAGLLAALSLYSPFQLYVVITLVATCFIHPHARFIIFHLPKWLLAISAVVFALFVSPLALSLVHQTSLLPELLGIPHNFAAVVNFSNLQSLLHQYAGFYDVSNQAHISPAFGLGLTLLALLGLYRLFTAKYTAKSYIITLWLVFLVPLTIISQQTLAWAFVPVILLAAQAIDYLIRSWYRLFPNNPYARVVGLLPLTVLLAGLALSGVERFAYGYHYDPAASQIFSHDLTLLNRAVHSEKAESTLLIVPENQAAFYSLYASKLRNAESITVKSDAKAAMSLPSDTLLITSPDNRPLGLIPSKIIVSDTAENADRFYLYKNS